MVALDLVAVDLDGQEEPFEPDGDDAGLEGALSGTPPGVQGCVPEGTDRGSSTLWSMLLTFRCPSTGRKARSRLRRKTLGAGPLSGRVFGSTSTGLIGPPEVISACWRLKSIGADG